MSNVLDNSADLWLLDPGGIHGVPCPAEGFGSHGIQYARVRRERHAADTYVAAAAWAEYAAECNEPGGQHAANGRHGAEPDGQHGAEPDGQHGAEHGPDGQHAAPGARHATERGARHAAECGARHAAECGAKHAEPGGKHAADDVAGFPGGPS